MAQRNTQKLRTVSNFPDLVDYLRDDLDWPIEVEDAEEIVFEYDPDELGIDPKYAVKINSIRQIRPLAEGQPWGVFYIDFESKKLPVVVLRRILRAFVSSTRSRQAERPVWDMNDLLFISAFGEEVANQREIAFAHFHQEAGNLPTLRVLGWDGSDTPLKLEYVDATLQRTMRWPDDPDDHEAWREEWSQTFRHRLGHVIRTADALAAELAELARQIRDAATLLLAHETESGPLRSLHKAFQTALIHDLSEADFADTYAQTITYGLLTAAISRTEMSDGQYGTALIADNVADIVPVTNPFLKEMLQTFLSAGGRKGGIDFDELGIQDVVELLRGDETDLPAVLRDFGNKTKGEDPVIHFYEHFLAAYDKELKVKRGVFYTPKPVVSYMVRSVHELLQTEFGLEDGLADTTTWWEMAQHLPDITIPVGTDLDSPFVVILDPATGTATFLVEVIEVIHQTMTTKWRRSGLNAAQQQDKWNKYVPQHILPRLYGYELMMAPYAIAHMKIGLKLYETGYRFGSEERVRIYLTNTLESANSQKVLEGILPALAHEAQAVSEIKKKQRFTVVIGNPPYAGWSANLTPTARAIVDRYKFVGSERIKERGALQFEKNLQDDYVKFFAWSEDTIKSAGVGILSLICNHGFIDTPTLRGMRWQLLDTFCFLHFLDLHGSTKRPRENDENVFDIQQGVAISLLAKTAGSSLNKSVKKANLIGKRNRKYSFLSNETVQTTEWAQITPLPPFFQYLSLDTNLQSEYMMYTSLIDMMPVYSTGTETGFDALMVDFTVEELLAKLEKFLAPEKTYLQVEGEFSIGGGTARKLLDNRTDFNDDFEQNAEHRCTSGMYRVFDKRVYYYKKEYLKTNSFKIMRHLMQTDDNLALVAFRQQSQDGFQHAFVTRDLGDKNAVSLRTREVKYYFPLYLLPENEGLQIFKDRFPNLKPGFLKEMRNTLEVPDGVAGISEKAVTPENVLNYTYSVFHSSNFRSRYAEFLKIDFPRIPHTGSLDLFLELAQLGGELINLHLMEFSLPEKTDAPSEWPLYPRLAQFNGGNRDVEKFPTAKKAWQDGRVAINDSSGFTGIPEQAWDFYIGGYQVCHKWLKDRKGRTLRDADVLHYCKIVTAINETIRIMAEIDDVIEEHGGWPIE